MNQPTPLRHTCDARPKGGPRKGAERLRYRAWFETREQRAPRHDEDFDNLNVIGMR